MIRFSAVNRLNSNGYNPLYQRHHLIPLQATSIPELRSTLGSKNSTGFYVNDFEANGILLPCDETVAMLSGRPLHRGPHPRYNELVIDRLLLIECKGQEIDSFNRRQEFYGFRIKLLQRALRRGLAVCRFEKLRLNSRDPTRSHGNFEHLDASVDRLYDATKHPFRG